LMVTNGLNHYFCQMDFENEKYDSSYSWLQSLESIIHTLKTNSYYPEKIAVVILNWNGVQLLGTILPSVVQFSPEVKSYM
jgi:hypothetical protein